MNWIQRKGFPLINLEQTASVSLRRCDGRPDVDVVFVLASGKEEIWECNSMDEAEGVLYLIMQTINPVTISSTKAVDS